MRWRTTWFKNANLLQANLTGANLTSADCRGASFAYADLSDGHPKLQRPSPSPKVRGRLTDFFLHNIQAWNDLARGPAILTDCELYGASFHGALLEGTRVSQRLSAQATSHSAGVCTYEPTAPSSDKPDSGSLV